MMIVFEASLTLPQDNMGTAKSYIQIPRYPIVELTLAELQEHSWITTSQLSSNIQIRIFALSNAIQLAVSFVLSAMLLQLAADRLLEDEVRVTCQLIQDDIIRQEQQSAIPFF